MKKSLAQKITAVLCSAALLTGMTGALPAYAEAGNLITNSGFDSSIDGWSEYSHSDAAADIYHENGMLALNITALGSVNYAVQLSSNSINIESGKSYRVSFDISSTVSRDRKSVV